jgi:hypothetical protein
MESQARSAPQAQHNSITEAVINAVADAEGVPPEELRPTLYDVIDPDALENLYEDTERSITTDLSVTFSYGDWSVHVHSNGEVSVIQRPGVRPGDADEVMEYR